MTFFKSLILAFSMFSKVPMPKVEWNAKNMRYMMCFFPFVGFFIGIFEILIFVLFESVFHESQYLFALFFTLIPILVTGGIHIDGFMDTCDALGSHAPIEKKLEILKDSHVGSFAVLGICIYLLSFFVISLEIFNLCHFEQFLCHFERSREIYNAFIDRFLHSLRSVEMTVIPVSSIFVISRFLSALAVALFPCAKNSGLLHTFSDSAARKFTVIWCVVFLIAIYSALIFFFVKTGIIIVATSLIVFVYYFYMSKKQFSGITGDLAGWFVQMCEILCLGFILVCQLI